jgi:hypothetical protein
VPPSGWEVTAEPHETRSILRAATSSAELRVVAQPAPDRPLEESDAVTAKKLLREVAREAGNVPAEAVEVESSWRTIGGIRALQLDVRVKAPSFLWMRQIKFRTGGTDHLLAASTSVEGQESATAEAIEEFAKHYRPNPAAAGRQG